MTEERKKSLHPISETLCKVYNSFVRKGEVSFPLHDLQIQKIDSIVKTVHASYFGPARFKTREEKAAAYFCLIIKGHPVVDGNKRLAVVWLEIFCDAFELPISLSSSLTLDVLAVSVEKSKLDHHTLIQFVKDILFNN